MKLQKEIQLPKTEYATQQYSRQKSQCPPMTTTTASELNSLTVA